jgi:hypothetical protein
VSPPDLAKRYNSPISALKASSLYPAALNAVANLSISSELTFPFCANISKLTVASPTYFAFSATLDKEFAILSTEPVF